MVIFVKYGDQIYLLKKDLLKHKTVKKNDEIQHFHYQEKITAFEAILAQRINIRRCKDYKKRNCKNTFAQMESDCTLRFGFNTVS